MLPSKLLIVSHNGSPSFLTFSSRCRPWASVWARDIPTTAVKGTTAGQSGVSPPAHRVPVWGATMTTSGVATFILAGSEESEAA